VQMRSVEIIGTRRKNPVRRGKPEASCEGAARGSDNANAKQRKIEFNKRYRMQELRGSDNANAKHRKNRGLTKIRVQRGKPEVSYERAARVSDNTNTRQRKNRVKRKDRAQRG
jgi:hypothetical protein